VTEIRINKWIEKNSKAKSDLILAISLSAKTDKRMRNIPRSLIKTREHLRFKRASKKYILFKQFTLQKINDGEDV